jgi:hypothetical protein
MKKFNDWLNEADSPELSKKQNDMANFAYAIQRLQIVLNQLSNDHYHEIEDVPNLAEVKNTIEKFLSNNKYHYLGN